MNKEDNNFGRKKRVYHFQNPKHHQPPSKRQTQDLNKHQNTAHDVKKERTPSLPLSLPRPNRLFHFPNHRLQSNPFITILHQPTFHPLS